MLIDIGVNLTSSQFKNDQSAIIDRAIAANVHTMVVTGTNVDESKAALGLVQQHPQHLVCTAGVHPHDAKDAGDDLTSQLTTLLEHQAVVAVGECGLDFNRDFSPRPIQESVFASQVALASELDMPLFMHERDAIDRFIAIYTAHSQSTQQGVLHCFTGSKEDAKRYLDLDLSLGVTGWVCDERRGQALREAVSYIPNDRLLLETDAPYLLPRDLKPKPKSRKNEPMHLPHIASAVAQIKGIPVEELINITSLNAKNLFKLKNSSILL